MDVVISQGKGGENVVRMVGENKVVSSVGTASATAEKEEYRLAIKKLIDSAIKTSFDDELRKATLEIQEEQKRAVKELIDEQRTLVRKLVDEEKKAIWAKIEETKKNVLVTSK